MSEAETQNLSKIYGNARNNALSALTQGVKSSTATLKQQASYDITEAFNNYKQQQLALRASTFGTGSKDYLTNKNTRAFDATSMATAGSFENQYNNLVGNALSNAASVNQSYDTNMAKGIAQIATDYAKREADLAKQFETQGAIMDKIDNKILEYADSLQLDYDLSKLYTYVKDEKGNITHRTLSNAGKALYKEVLEGDIDGINFRDYGAREGWFTADEYDQYINYIKEGYSYNEINDYNSRSILKENTFSPLNGTVNINGTVKNYIEADAYLNAIDSTVTEPKEFFEDMDSLAKTTLANKYKYSPVGTFIALNDIGQDLVQQIFYDWYYSPDNHGYKKMKQLDHYGFIVTEDGLKFVILKDKDKSGGSGAANNKSSYNSLK